MIPTISVRPVVVPAPAARGAELQVRVSAPVAGEKLPVVVFSHGFASSMDGYGPLTDHWAAHGFVVVQPTHLDSLSLGLTPDDPRTPRIWRHRIADLRLVLDELDRVEAAIPGLAGRVDRSRVAVAGHSYGATTASALIGARVLDADGAPGEDFADPRVAAGVLLAVAGTGGEDLSPFAAEHFPFMNPSFDAMARPALIGAGDADQSQLSTRGPDWWTDAYVSSPGEKALLTLFGAEHELGGIPSYADSPHTTAESRATVALIQRVTTAYLHRALGLGDEDWDAMRAALDADPDAAGRLESK
jgi:fermentation-respiration switch protein FrsA (DUF1100 family)